MKKNMCRDYPYFATEYHIRDVGKIRYYEHIIASMETYKQKDFQFMSDLRYAIIRK